MITFYFDTNLRTLIQTPGNQAAVSPQTWVYGDNYNLQVYVCQAGLFLPILSSDTITAMLYQPQPNLPEQQLAIIGTPSILTDANGNNYFSININLATTQLAALTQATNKSAVCQFHLVFNPTDKERFSESQDVQTTVNPDPTQGATGGTPVPPGYPSNPNVFEQVVNKNAVGGYAGLDANAHSNPAQIPTDTSLQIVSGLLSVAGGAGGGNPYVAVIAASFTIPAENATVAVTLAAAVPDLVANQFVTVTDGVSTLSATIVSVSGTALTLRNVGGGAISGTMAASSHIYMGGHAGIVDTTVAGLVPALPTTVPAKQFFRGDGGYAQANYPDLLNIPATFAPSGHANTHLSTGGDPIALATVSAAGLCPPPDGSTIIVSGGKLVSTVSGGAGNPYVATIPASFAIPTANGTVGPLTMGATAADMIVGASLLISDGSHLLNCIVTAISGTSLTVRNTGSTNGAVSGTMGAGSHVYLGNNADLASTSTPGIVRPDGTTIVIASGVLSSAAVAPGQHGCRLRNSAAITYPPTNNLMTWDTVEWGTDTFAPAANGTAITIPSGMTGLYEIGTWIGWTASTSGTYRRVAIRYNATLNNFLGSSAIAPAGAGQAAEQNISTVFKLNAGDTLDVYVITDATGVNLLSAYFHMPAFWCIRIS